MPAAAPLPEHAEAARLVRAGRLDDAIRLYADLLGRKDDLHQPRLEMFEAIATTIRERAGPPRPPLPIRIGPKPFVSVVVCSIDDAKWRATATMYARLLDGWPHEVIGLSDARSLSEAYNRGIGRAKGDILVFSHDDVAFLTDDVFDRLSVHLDTVDLVGLAGTTRVAGPSWIQGGWRTMRGQVATPERSGKGLRLDVYGVDGPLSVGIQALDGLFIACRREVVETLRFDERTFDGFHLYDTDFGWRAHRAGFRLGVANDLPALHSSRGLLGEAWQLHANRFLAKYPNEGFGPTFADNPLRAVTLDDADQVRRFCDAMVALAAQSAPGVLAPAPVIVGTSPLLAMLPAGLGRVARLGDGDRTVGRAYRHANPGCRFDDVCWTASWRDEDLPDGLDCLILDGVLAHFDHPAATVRRHLERLAPGGRLLVGLPNPQHWPVIEGLLKGRPAPPGSGGRLPARLFTLDQALAALRDAGLERFEIASCMRAEQNGGVVPDAIKAALNAIGIEPEAFAGRSAAHYFVIRAQRQRTE